MGDCYSKFRGSKNEKKNDGDEDNYKNFNDLADYDEESRIEFGPLYMINEEKSDINTLDIKKRYRYNIESVYF
ncbi:hypothetical protein SKPV-WA-043 [Skunkpox virus]|uniref:Protein OPG051 n=1 Tax=Skunkpox virus TaxID=160796 RepID=A0A1C9KBJ5_9POXV|nr:hypothetical protein BIZ96_gp043 [Skunkpox virus]AOP31522.1 hypothetical protein SKPV-WA-043 [Skunkpox virus]